MISYAQALALVLAEAEPVVTQNIAPAEALGRVLAQDVSAPRSLPPFDNSAMDGFALRAADTRNAPVDLPVSASMAAGDAPLQGVPGGVVEIMTGAPVPGWCDTVVPVENVQVERGPEGAPVRVHFTGAVPKDRHIRRAGEDVQKGQVLLHAGTSVSAQAMAVLTALGLEHITVAARPAIALIGTGAEVVRDPATALKPGQIYDSNTPYLRAALAQAGYEAQVLAGSHDDAEAFLQTLKAAGKARIIISTGAVSMGRRDFVPQALARFGAHTIFHKCAIRPGKPVLFARLPGGAYFFGLPGNPVSAAVGLAFFVQPLLNRLVGRPAPALVYWPLKAPFRKKAPFTFFAKARLEGGQIEILPGQQSFRIAPLLTANGWAVLPAGKAEFAAGDRVGFEPFIPGSVIQ